MDNERAIKNYVRRSREEIAQLLSDFECSGLSQQAFCRQRGVSPATFSKWRSKAASGADGQFREVRLTADCARFALTVRLVCGTELFFAAGTPAGEVAAMLGTLKRADLC